MKPTRRPAGMMMRAAASLLLLFIATSASVAQHLPGFPRPVGIYAIGQSDAAGIRALPFVDGFVMRIDWSAVEPAPDVYDFSRIDAVVRRLDTLGQGLTLDIFRFRTPSYIMQLPGVQTHMLRLSRDSFLTAVPWDTLALDRFERLHAALAQHRVWSIGQGADLPLAAHPVLRQIDATPIGTNGLRDLNHSLTSHPAYTRPLLVDAVLRTAEIVGRHFPATFRFVALFGMRDDIAAPVLTDVLRDALLRQGNLDPARPMLGFFQENLACAGPTASPSNPLFAARDSTFTMYQMLQGWRSPFLDSAKTDVCRTDTSGPDVAMLKALALTYSTYFEIYAADLDFPGYAAMFTRMHDTLARHGGVPTGIGDARIAVPPRAVTLLSLAPHPFRDGISVRYTVGSATGSAPTCVLRVHDLFGRVLRTVDGGDPGHGAHESRIETADLPPGAYILTVTAGRATASRVILRAP